MANKKKSPLETIKAAGGMEVSQLIKNEDKTLVIYTKIGMALKKAGYNELAKEFFGMAKGEGEHYKDIIEIKYTEDKKNKAPRGDYLVVELGPNYKNIANTGFLGTKAEATHARKKLLEIGSYTGDLVIMTREEYDANLLIEKSKVFGEGRVAMQYEGKPDVKAPRNWKWSKHGFTLVYVKDGDWELDTTGKKRPESYYVTAQNYGSGFGIRWATGHGDSKTHLQGTDETALRQQMVKIASIITAKPKKSSILARNRAEGLKVGMKVKLLPMPKRAYMPGVVTDIVNPPPYHLVGKIGKIVKMHPNGKSIYVEFEDHKTYIMGTDAVVKMVSKENKARKKNEQPPIKTSKAIRDYLGFNRFEKADEYSVYINNDDQILYIIEQVDVWRATGNEEGQRYRMTYLEISQDELDDMKGQKVMKPVIEQAKISEKQWMTLPYEERAIHALRYGLWNENYGEYDSIFEAWKAVRDKMHPTMNFKE
jgi:hypothetical protein